MAVMIQKLGATVSRRKTSNLVNGLSTLLGTIILMGIALAAGVSIFNMANQYAVVGFSKTEYSIMEATITKSTISDSCFLSIRMMNAGTNKMADTQLEISTDRNGIPENLIIDKDLQLTLTFVDDDTKLVFWTSNNTLFIKSKSNSIEPKSDLVIDSIIFTNMTGKVKDAKVKGATSTDLENKLQPLFNECSAWKDCLTYTVEVLGRATDGSEAATSGLLHCKESDRL